MKWLFSCILTILIGTQFFLYTQWKESASQLAFVERELATTASKLKKQERYTRGNLEKLGQTVSMVANRRPSSPSVPGQSVSKQAIAELLMVESFRLDRLVEWVDLIEDKMYFIIFPGEQTDREQLSQSLQTRTREIRAQFAEAAQQSVALRQKIIAQTESGGGTQAK